MFLRSLLVRYLLNIALEHQIYLQNTAHVKWSFYSVSSSRSYSNKIKSYLLLLHKLQKFCCFSTSFIFRFIYFTCCNNYQINALRRLLITFLLLKFLHELLQIWLMPCKERTEERHYKKKSKCYRNSNWRALYRVGPSF